MSWLQIKIQVNPQNAEPYEDILLAAGCAAVVLHDSADEPIFEPDLGTTPLWSTTTLVGLFSADHNLDETRTFITTALQQLFPDLPTPSIFTEILEDKDWEREWMENYHPMKFGNRLWVCPSWRDVPDPTAVNLMLDPGLAFGTGTHPTTALCLEWLDNEPLEGKDVVDFGCGSGILGIAALLLGAKHVTAIDIDPQALQATLDNLQRNQLATSKLDCWLPENAPKTQADLLVANILAGPLTSLAEEIAGRVRPNGRLVISGLLENQATELAEAYTPWFEMEAAVSKEGWIRIAGTRKAL